MADAIGCLDRDELQGFLLGRVAVEREVQFAEHVESCPVCVRCLAGLQQSDDLLDAARLPLTAVGPTALVQNLLARVCALSAANSGIDTALSGAPADPSGPEVTQELYDFLAPAQLPDEMGRLGPYRLLHVLGRGGMGVVFQAEDGQLQRLVALKVLRPTLLASASARQRFLREARAAARVVHERIGSVLHVGEERGIPYLVMPLLEGETLEARLEREPFLPAPEVVRIGTQIAEGLAAAHAQGLIHRDVKPSNVWLEPTAGVKLLDFGLARDIEGPHITRSGTIVGTPAYMAPEQARGEALDVRSDLFSLGCLLYRLATGELPFKGVTVLATLRALELEVPRPPNEVNPAVPVALSDLILRLLAKHKEDRCPSAHAVIAELNSGRPARPRFRRRPALRGGLLLGLLVLFVAGFFLLRLPRPVSPGNALAPASDLPAHFALSVSYPVGKRPYAVAVGDVNNDGKLDLVTSSIDDNTLSVLLGNGDGTFQAGRTLPTGKKPHDVRLADFNADGWLDLAVVNLDGDSVNVFLNAGNGVFAPPATYRTRKGPRGLTVGDFNGDGHLDFVALSATEWPLTLWLGNGAGHFRAGAAIEGIGGSAVHIVAADLDHNGTLDLVTSSGGGDSLGVLLGTGAGSFQPPRRQAVGSGPGAIAVGDFNRDGHPDLAVENFGTHDVSVLLGNGDGNFRPHTRFPAGFGPGGLATGDFNGDGVLDLVVANHHSHNLSFLIGNGDGTFRPPDHRAAGWTPAGVAVGDFNGDGRLDAVTVNHLSHTASVFLNRPAAPHFRLVSPYEVEAGDTHTVALTAVTAAGTVNPGFRGQVRLCCDDGQPLPSSELTDSFTASANGTWPLRVALKKSGLQTWTATAVDDPALQGSIAILVRPAPTAALRVEAPRECRAGTAVPIVVTTTDAYGNLTPAYTGAVQVSSSDSAWTRPGPVLFREADGGVRRFEVAFHTPGTQSVTVTDPRLDTLKATVRLMVQPAR